MGNLENKIVFNFFGDKNEVVSSLASYIGVDCEELYRLISDRESHGLEDKEGWEKEIELIQNEFGVNFRDKEIENVYVKLKHITTTRDNLETVKKYGLRDLQFVLEGDTYLNKFLKQNGLVFDINNKKIYIDGECKDISSLKSDKPTSLIYTKLYSHKCQIEAFSSSEHEEIHYSCVNNHPEILTSMDMCLKKNLTEKWENGMEDKYYVLEFDVPIKHLNYKYPDINRELIKKCYYKKNGEIGESREQIVNKKPIPFENIKVVAINK